MIKTFKKSISIILTLVFVLSLMPFGTLVEATEGKTVAKFTFAANNSGENADRVDFGYVRTDKPAQWFQKAAYTGATSGDLYYGMNLSSMYRDFVQLDLSGYEEILRNDSTTIYMNLQRRGNDANYSIVDHHVYFAPDNCDFLDFSSDATMNYSVAQASGFTKEDNLFYVDSDGEDTATYSSGEISPENLIKALDENPGNSKVSLYIKGKGNTAGGNAARIAVTSSTYFAISYDESEIDNQAYVDEIAENYQWSEVSDMNIDAISGDINLPAKYRGADVTWSSNDTTVVEDDGTVHFGKGVQSATLTATLCYKGIDESASEAVATKDFTISVTSEEAKEITVPFINYAHSRSDTSNGNNKIAQKYSTNSSYGQHYISFGGLWSGYAQFDLSDYEEILRNPSSKLQFKVLAGSGFSSGKLAPFQVYLAPDSVDAVYAWDTVTDVSAVSMGLKDNTRPLLANSDGSNENLVSNGTWFTIDADKDNLLQVLNESSSNSLVTMYFTGGVTSNIRMKEKNAETTNGGLVITYYESEIDEKAYIDEIESDLELEDLTGDSSGILKNNLPTYFRGASITWSADKDVVTADGKLKRSRDEAVSATLTAEVEYKGYTFTKDFDVTLAQNLPTVITIKGATATYIDSSKPSDAAGIYEKCFDTYRVENNGLYREGKNDRMTFLKWDLTGYEAIIDAATKLAVTWKNKSFSGASPMTFTVMNNVNDSWANADLTYNIAVETGMYTDPGVYSETDVTLATDMYITSPGLLEGFKTALSQNPENSIVSAKFTGQRWDAMSFRSNSRTYDLEITYYPEDVKSEDEFIAEGVDNMPWSAITAQSIDEVLVDLDLPQSFYGKSIEWASSDETVISSSGEVAKVSADTNIKLTATVDGKYTKTFDVTVPAKAFAVKANNTCENGSRAYMNYSDVYIYATEKVTIPLIAIAAYSNGKLTDVGDGSVNRIKFVKDYTIKPGVNNIKSDYFLLRNANEIKVFFWGGLDTESGSDALKPLYSVNNR